LSDVPLFIRACRGAAVERTPVWIMRQAGRYLPEYRALREKHDFLTACRTPELACAITLQPIERLGVDAAILFSDILIPAPGMGVPVRFDPGPRIDEPIRTVAAITRLRVSDPLEATGFVPAAVSLLKKELPPHVPLIGFAGAPFTVAAYLVEGGATKSFSNIKQLLYSDPRSTHELLAKLTDTMAAYLGAQIDAGADAVMLFDTWAGILAPEDYRAFARPYAARVLATVAAKARATGCDVPTIYYCGDAAALIAELPGIADVLGLDWRLPLHIARGRLGTSISLQGNLDPAVLLAPREVIRARTASMLTSLRNTELASVDPNRPGPARGHVFNLGHGITPDVPPDNARYLVDCVRELSSVRGQ